MNSKELSLIISEKNGGCLLKCWIQPRSSRSTIVGIHDDSIKIALTAPPVDGKANKELIKFMAKYFNLSKSDIQIVGGESSRSKTILLTGLNKDTTIQTLIKE